MTKPKPKTKEGWRERFQKKDGIEMRLFVDLMIANQGDKKVVRQKLDELDRFIAQELKKEREKIRKMVRELEVEMVDGIGWNRMHELVMDILVYLKEKQK